MYIYPILQILWPVKKKEAWNHMINVLGSFLKRFTLNSEFGGSLVWYDRAKWRNTEKTHFFWLMPFLDYKKCAITFDGINTYSSEFEYIKQCIYYRIFMILFQDFLKILKRCEHGAFEMLSYSDSCGYVEGYYLISLIFFLSFKKRPILLVWIKESL